MNYRWRYQRQSLLTRAEQFGNAHRRLQTMSFLKFALSSLVLFALTHTAFAQSALTDDADISLSSGNTNHGANSNLNVSATENVYLKFKLAATLPPGTSGSKIGRATLKLYVAKVNTAGKLDVYAVSGTWDESSITVFSTNNGPRSCESYQRQLVDCSSPNYSSELSHLMMSTWLSSPHVTNCRW